MQDTSNYLGSLLQSTPQNECAGCGRDDRPIKRVECGHRFCVNCYERDFIGKPCLQCGSQKRIHRSLTFGKCRDCFMGPRVCSRCDKPFKKAGKIVASLWVCPSCVPYFSEPKPCSICTAPSLFLSRSIKDGILEPACPKCRTAKHKTCSRCRRSRPVFSLDGVAPLCKACSGATPATHFCPSCLKRTPGSGSGRCNDCLSFSRYRSQQKGLVLQIENLTFVEFFNHLCDSEITNYGSINALKKLQKNSIFVVFLSTVFLNVSDITADRLLKVCTVEQLRRHSSVIDYLASHHQVNFSYANKIDAAESLRISKKLASITSKAYEADLTQYYEWLTSTNSRKLKTIRMYLQAAIQFLERCDVDSVSSLSDCEKVKWVIRQHPSQYASLKVFLTWCHEFHGISVPFAKPLTRTSSLERSVKLTARANASLKLALTETSLAKKKSALAHLLHLLYAIKISDVIQVKRADFEHRENQLLWHVDGSSIVLDSQVAKIIENILAMDSVNEFLFPGRISNHSMVAPSYPVLT